MIDADGAILARGAGAEMLVPHRQAHVDFLERRGEDRAAGAVAHALEPIADDAGHFIGVDVGNTGPLLTAEIDLDRLGRADANALAAATARAAKVVFGQCAR